MTCRLQQGTAMIAEQCRVGVAALLRMERGVAHVLKPRPALPEAAPATCSYTALKHRASPRLEPLWAAMLRTPGPRGFGIS